MKPLSKEEFDAIKDYRKEMEKLKKQLEKRTDEIVQYMVKKFYCKGPELNWWFSGAEEGERGNFFRAISGNYVSICFEFTTKRNVRKEFSDLHPDEIMCSFPVSWIYTDFEKNGALDKCIEAERKICQEN